jgi:hypothetical protein
VAGSDIRTFWIFMAIAPELNIQIPEVGQAIHVRHLLATVRAVDGYDIGICREGQFSAGV